MKFRLCYLLFDFGWNDLILQLFNYFISRIRKHHSDSVKTSMFNILSLILDEDEDVCKQLQLDLLFIWRRE